MNAPLLSVEGLSVRYGAAEVLADVSLSMSAGEVLALVGESGCGKSTLALALPRLLQDRDCTVSGRIAFDGRDVASLPPHALGQLRGGEIGMIFQDPSTSLNPVWTIGEQLVETLRLERVTRRSAKARALELLDQVAIPDPRRAFANFPHQLSGGMRQRAMIAIAIARNPPLLIADEPTTALDVTTQAQVLDLLARLQRELSMAMLLITHDLGIVADWATRVAVMYAGRIVEQAPTRTFFERPLHPYARRLIAATPALHGTDAGLSRLAEIPGSVASASNATGCRFAPRCADAQSSCTIAEPALLHAGEGHTVACPVTLRHDEVRDAAAVA